MPRLQPQNHHHHSNHHHSSPSKPITVSTTSPSSTPVRPRNKHFMSNKLLPPSSTPSRKSTPKPINTSSIQHRKQPAKSRKKNPLSPNPSKNHGTLSLLSFYDLSAELYSLSSRSNPKLKPSNRRPNKITTDHHALHSSDSEEVHSIFLPFTSQHSSRSSTPTPTKASGLAPSDPPFALDLDDLHPPSPTTHSCTTPPRTSFPPNSTPAHPPHRRHVRAKSVASIFELDKSTPSKVQLHGVRDDWDMPNVMPPQDLTWQQKDKKVSSPSGTHPSQNVIHHDAHKSSMRPVVPQSLKESTPSRQPKSSLARTTSAGTIGRLLPSSIQPTNPPPSYSSRSDDESALTWQQTIIRPLPKHKSLSSSQSNHPLVAFENKPVGHKKSQGTPHSLKTPVKAPSTARKAGVQSAAKTKPNSLQSSNRRRNSISSAQTSHSRKLSDMTPIQTHDLVSSPFGSKPTRDDLSWKSFPSSLAVNHQPDLPPLGSNSSPIVGALVDQTPPRRHTKSYTHQPAMLSSRRPNQSSHHATITSASAFSNIPESNSHKMMSTPSKSRSTSEDLNLASPEKQLTTPALRAFMYAGPQFHNSPCPAALPAPKFSFGSA